MSAGWKMHSVSAGHGMITMKILPLNEVPFLFTGISSGGTSKIL